MPRHRSEIMRDLHAIVAELTYSIEGDDPNKAAKVPEGAPVPSDEWKSDVSPKLKQALSQRPIESHEDIRAKARAYRPKDYGAHMDSVMDNKPEKPEALPKDYTPADDPSFDNSWALGSGDRSE